MLDRAILGPRFDWEAGHLLGHYQWIELVLVSEYVRMGLLDEEDAARIAAVLSCLSAERITAERAHSMSDLLFALERCVHAELPPGAAAWHVDRSRNDVQACAQLMYGRERILDSAAALARLCRAATARAAEHATSVMPGYTQYQTAQTITFGFYLAALADAAENGARSLVRLYDAVDLCPLGAGAMAGLELPWDRRRMAEALAFAGPEPHALTSVASRAWTLRVAAELAVLGTTFGRFLTDLLWWSGSSCRFIDLPDELAGISSAMPHKRNFPVLERLRGMAGHLVGLGVDLMVGQHNTGYSNLVEVSKESGRFLADMFAAGETMITLFEQVLTRVRFAGGRAAAVAGRELLAASTVANHLTLACGVPARSAQVVVGAWIEEALRQDGSGPDLDPRQLDAQTLAETAARHGFPVAPADLPLDDLLSAETAVYRRLTSGSTHPEQVRLLLDDVTARLGATERAMSERSARLRTARADAMAGGQVNTA